MNAKEMNKKKRAKNKQNNNNRKKNVNQVNDSLNGIDIYPFQLNPIPNVKKKIPMCERMNERVNNQMLRLRYIVESI